MSNKSYSIQASESGTIELVGTDEVTFFLNFYPTAVFQRIDELLVPSPASNTSDHEYVESSLVKIPCDRNNHWSHRCRHKWVLRFYWCVLTPKTLSFKILDD